MNQGLAQDVSKVQSKEKGSRGKYSINLDNYKVFKEVKCGNDYTIIRDGKIINISLYIIQKQY